MPGRLASCCQRSVNLGMCCHKGSAVFSTVFPIFPRGANGTAELKAALDSGGALVVFISPGAVASRSVSHEIEYSLGAKHLRGRLIPVTIRPTKDAPWILGSLQLVQYQSPDKTGRQIVELLAQSPDAPEAKIRTH